MQREASSSNISQDLSAEQFTLAKEMEQRERGADLITIDNGESGSGVEGAYRPKVATWGVFPRPSNISREYGGGRTLRPGEVAFRFLAARVLADYQLPVASNIGPCKHT